MKKINVVGLGVGNIDYLTMAGIKHIKSCDIVVGGKRQIEDISSLLNISQEKYILKNLTDTINFIKENKNKKEITVVVSGDTGFYSLLNFLKNNIKDENFNVVPGISSFQYLFAKLSKSWEHYSLYSVHGRELDVIEALKKSINGIILLTDDKNSPYNIGRILMKNNFLDIKMIVGERLSYPDEKITEFFVRDIENQKKEYKMNILILEKEK